MSEPLCTWPDRNDRVPYWIYTDQGNYERELENIFYGPVWNYVGLECEIPKPGDYKRTQIGDQSVIVVRDIDDGVNVLVNRCAHRGVKIFEQDSGSFNEIMCPYHQWTYTLDGVLTGMPFKRAINGKGGLNPDFDMQKHGLLSLRVETLNGVVFASFGDLF